MFINTFKSPFYEHMLGSVSSNFSNIVIIEEMIEFGMKSGKIAHSPFAVANPERSNLERKEGEVQVISNLPSSNAPPMPNNLY